MKRQTDGFYLAGRAHASAFVRPVTAEDKTLLIAGFEQASAETIYRRFFKPVAELSNRQIQYLIDVDQENHVAWGLFAVDGRNKIPAGIGRFVRLKDRPQAAELAVTVLDAYQESGFGSLLILLMLALARRRNITQLTGHIQPGNDKMLRLIRKFGAQLERDEDDIIHVSIPVGPALAIQYAEPGLVTAVNEIEARLA